jgi:hypothetical protein
MAVHQPPSPFAELGGDPEQIVNEFWDAFEVLLSRYNERRIAAKKSTLTWRELADKVDISDRTLSDWRNKPTVPANPEPLVEAARFLGGRQEDWQAWWREARDAHERLVASRQAQRKPGNEEDHSPVPHPGLPPGGEDDSTEGELPGDTGLAGDTSTGIDGPSRHHSRRPSPLILIAVAVTVTAVLVSLFMFTPLRSWVDKHLFQSGSAAGAALTVTAEPVFLDDQGRTMATADGHRPSPQILHQMSQPGAAASPGFLQKLRSDDGVDVEASTVQLIVNGHSSQGIRIIGIRPVALHRTAPLSGTLYLMPPQAGNATIRMMFDLDELNPLARQIGSFADPGAGDPQQQVAGFIHGVQPGNPFFGAETIHLADNEQQVLNIRMQITRFYATLDLEIDYIVGTDSSVVHKLIVTDNGHPFSITGTPLGGTRGTATYQQGFQLQGNFSLCQISAPVQIPLSATMPPPPCRQR